MVRGKVYVRILVCLENDFVEVVYFSFVSLCSGSASMGLGSSLEIDLRQAGTLVHNLGCRSCECQAGKCECLEHWLALWCLFLIIDLTASFDFIPPFSVLRIFFSHYVPNSANHIGV